MTRQTPRDSSWGEQTVQAVGGYGSAPADWHTDADEIRRKFGIPSMDVEEFIAAHDGHKDAIVYPDMLIHERDPTRTRSNKGTDCLFRGKRDAGKTTQALNFSTQLMGENDEKVIWRGRRGGSGWLPLKHWATVFLPDGLEIDAKWFNEDDDRKAGDALAEIDNLEDEVRKVVYYDGIYDLLDKLGEHPKGTFNVVYPDPAFRDCSEITEKTDRGDFGGSLPFTPAWEADENQIATPLNDWWVPFLVGRAEYGPFEWMSWLCDEAGDLFPVNAKNEDGRPLHDLISLLRGVWGTSRKRYLSLYMWVHHEANLAGDIRREFKWRVCMPDGSSNPRKSVRSSHPVGMKGDIQMEADMMTKRKDRYEAMCYNGPDWAFFTWSNVTDWPEDDERWLSIASEPGDSPPRPQGSDAEDTDAEEEVTLEYDHRIFGEWQNASAHRLIVKEPGGGYISVHGCSIGEELVSPVDGLEFAPTLRDNGAYREAIMIDDDDDEIVVARVPLSETTSGEVGGVAGD